MPLTSFVAGALCGALSQTIQAAVPPFRKNC